MKPESIHNKRILLSPLNWGMGHVARCIPIIDQLLKQSNKVIIACNQEQKNILTVYFPEIEYIAHEGYPFSFKGKGSFGKDLFFSFLKLNKRLKAEKKEIEKIVTNHAVDLILSDHRYGCISKKRPSVFITHQLNLPVPWYGKWGDRLHKKMIQSFNSIWVLDTHDSQFAGKLSKNTGFKNLEYIGPQSRFSLYQEQEKTIPLVVIISGPEPYAEQFFQEEYKTASLSNKKTVIITPKIYHIDSKIKAIELVLSSNWKDCDQIILKAQKIISRTGYSTIMDLEILKVPSELFFTTGQLEQEYLFKKNISHPSR